MAEEQNSETPAQIALREFIRGLVVPSAAEITPNDASIKEEIALKRGINLEDREALNALNQLDRQERFSVHLHYVSVGMLYLVAFLVAALVIALVADMILPDKLRPLTPEETQRIYAFLFTGTSGGIITGFISKYVSKDKPKDGNSR